MPNLAPAYQDMAVLDIGMAQVKLRCLDDLQGRNQGIAHAALLGKKRDRCPDMWSAGLSAGAELEEAGTMPNWINQKI